MYNVSSKLLRAITIEGERKEMSRKSPAKIQVPVFIHCHFSIPYHSLWTHRCLVCCQYCLTGSTSGKHAAPWSVTLHPMCPRSTLRLTCQKTKFRKSHNIHRMIPNIYVFWDTFILKTIIYRKKLALLLCTCGNVTVYKQQKEETVKLRAVHLVTR